MTKDCLILNGDGKPLSYFPLSSVDWKTAVKLIITRNVIIIKEYPDWTVRSPSTSFKVPSIVMLRKFYKFSSKVKFSRSNVFLRDMFTCQYCKDVFEKKDLTIDHLIPKSKGGVTSWENVTTSCKSCNLKKADNIPEKLPKAEKPSFRDLIKGEQHASGKSISLDWQEYIVA